MKIIAEEIRRISKLITALDDVDFRRFKDVFDRILVEKSVDVGMVMGANVRDYVANVMADEDPDFPFTDRSRVERQTIDIYEKKIRPILRKIGSFMSGRMWIIVKANDIYNDIYKLGDDYDFNNSAFASVRTGVCKEVIDYFESFVKAANEYMDASASSPHKEEFELALGSILRYIGGFGENLKVEYSDFEFCVKSAIEYLRAAYDAKDRGSRSLVNGALSRFDALMENMRSKSADYGRGLFSDTGLYNLFFNFFVRSRDDAAYDLRKWQNMLVEFRKRFGIVPRCIDGIRDAIGRFYSKHAGGSMANYRDDAIRCYDEMLGDYSNLIRALGNSGVVFDIDEYMSKAKKALDLL